VPLYNPRAVVVLSARVGNYQFNPYWTLLIDQLWVSNRGYHQVKSLGGASCRTL